MGPSAIHTRPLFWILLLALLLRLALFLAIAPHPDRFYSIDSPGFVSLGTNLREAYAVEGGKLFRLGLRHTPGYPLVIAAGFSVTGDDPWGVIVFQIAVGVFTVWLTYRLAFRLVGPEAALWAALALAVDPISIILANYLQPETFFTFLVVAGALLWARGLQEHEPWLAAGAGALLGAAALVRPIALYIPAVLIPASLLLHEGRWAQRLLFTSAIVLLFAVPVGAWTVRNVSLTGVPLFTTADGHNLLYYRVALALAEEEGLPFKEAQDRLNSEVQQRARPGMNAAEVSLIERSMALRYLLSHPAATLKQMTNSLLLTMIGPGRAELLQLLGDPTPTKISGPVQISLIVGEFLIYGIILISAIVGCYLLLRQRKYFTVTFLASIIGYFIFATAVGSLGYSRYRVPLMPFIAVFAGYGFVAWRRRRSRAEGAKRESRPGQA